VVSDPAVAAAEDQNLDELVEDDPIGDAAAVTAERMDGLPGRQKGGELGPQGFENARWQGRHGNLGGQGV
jgi:hypothetical protein